jgi:hypothetical protein
VACLVGAAGGPAAPSEVTEPTDKRRWRNDPPRATIRTEHPDQRREQRTIGPIHSRTARRPTEHRDLVAQTDHLCFAAHSLAATNHETERGAEREVHEAKEHPQILPDGAEPCSRAETGVLKPFTLDQRPPVLPSTILRPPRDPPNVRRRDRLSRLIHEYEIAA